MYIHICNLISDSRVPPTPYTNIQSETKEMSFLNFSYKKAQRSMTKQMTGKKKLIDNIFQWFSKYIRQYAEEIPSLCPSFPISIYLFFKQTDPSETYSIMKLTSITDFLCTLVEFL